MIEERTVQDYAAFCASLVPPPLRAKKVKASADELVILCSHPDVTEIAATPQAVHVGTRILIADNDIHAIGEFMLTISTSNVIWENLTHPLKNGFQAPYVSYNKVLCGQNSINREIQMYVKEASLHHAFARMIQAAKLTPGYSPGGDVTSWPKASKEFLEARRLGVKFETSIPSSAATKKWRFFSWKR